MISADLTGNLGNFMHQYAVTRMVAEHNNYEWGFNPIVSNDYHQGKPQMDFMQIDYGKQHTAKWKELPEGIDKEWAEPTQTFYHVDKVDYHPFSPEVFDIQDNTKLVISSCQDTRYFDKEKVKSWFQIKEENINAYKQQIAKYFDLEDDNLCLINARGGEYIGIRTLFLTSEYWQNAINIMREINVRMKFVVITDDVPFFRTVFPCPVYHFSIGADYFAINQAKHLIISNSSFALFPSWLNQNAKMIIAPRHWARYNVAENYWANSDIFTYRFDFLDRDGKLYKQ